MESNHINRSLNVRERRETFVEDGNTEENYTNEETIKFETKTNISNESREGGVSTHPLFSHGQCRWTGCELADFKTLQAFKEHLSRDHVLDERSTAQTRVQVSKIMGCM